MSCKHIVLHARATKDLILPWGQHNWTIWCHDHYSMWKHVRQWQFRDRSVHNDMSLCRGRGSPNFLNRCKQHVTGLSKRLAGAQPNGSSEHASNVHLHSQSQQRRELLMRRSRAHRYVQGHTTKQAIGRVPISIAVLSTWGAHHRKQRGRAPLH